MRRLAILLAVVMASSWGCGEEKVDGPYVLYHDNGKMKEQGTYKDGKLEGDFFQYYEDGTIKHEGYYEEGELNGKLSFYESYIEYFETPEGAKLRVEGIYKNGARDGAYTVYYGESADKKVTGTYKNANKHGTWSWFSKDGQKKTQRQWDNGELIKSLDCTEEARVCE